MWIETQRVQASPLSVAAFRIEWQQAVVAWQTQPKISIIGDRKGYYDHVASGEEQRSCTLKPGFVTESGR